MSASRTLLVVIALLLPTAVSGTGVATSAGNEGDIDLQGSGNAMATCQFGILINSVLILSVEDALGLVGPPPDATNARQLVIPGGDARHVATASCSTTIRNLNLTVHGAPPGLEGALAPGGVILGPPANTALATAAAEPSAGNRAHVTTAGSGNGVATCQYLLLVNTVIVGGGALGLTSATGTAPAIGPALVQNGGASSQATCKTVLDNVKIRVLAR